MNYEIEGARNKIVVHCNRMLPWVSRREIHGKSKVQVEEGGPVGKGSKGKKNSKGDKRVEVNMRVIEDMLTEYKPLGLFEVAGKSIFDGFNLNIECLGIDVDGEGEKEVDNIRVTRYGRVTKQPERFAAMFS